MARDNGTDDTSDDAHGHSHNVREQIAKRLNADSRRSPRQREIERAYSHVEDRDSTDLGHILRDLQIETGGEANPTGNREEMLRRINTVIESYYEDSDEREVEDVSRVSKPTLYDWLKQEPYCKSP